MFILRVLLLSFLAYTPLYAQYEHLLNQKQLFEHPYLEDFYNIKINNLDSVSLFAEIYAMRQFAKDHQDPNLALETEVMEAYYFQKRRTNIPILAINAFSAIRTKAFNENNQLLIARLEFFEATRLWEVEQNYEASIQHLLKQIELFKKARGAFKIDLRPAYYRLAEAHYFFKDFNSAISYFKEVLKINVANNTDYYFFHCNNTIGLCFLEFKQLDSANIHFVLAYKRAKQLNYSDWMGIAGGNIGNVLFLKNQFAEALPYLNYDFNLSIKRKDWACASGSLMVLADINLHYQQLNIAEKQLNQARKYIKQSGQFSRLQKLFPLLCKLNILKGDKNLAIAYQDSTIYIKDSLSKIFNAIQLLRVQEKAEMLSQEIRIESLNNENNIKTIQRNLFIGLFLLSLLAAFGLYKYKQKKNLIQHQEALLAIEAKNKEIIAANDELRELVQRKITSGVELNSVHRLSDLNEMEALKESQLLSSVDWIKFKHLFEKIHVGFLTRLVNQYADLTQSDIKYIALLKLGYNNKEMADTLGVSNEAIRTKWHRLRKKLNIKEGCTQEEFVSNI